MTAPAPAPAPALTVTYGGLSLGKIRHGDLLIAPRLDPPAAVRAAQSVERAAATVTACQKRHRDAADAYLRIKHERGTCRGGRGLSRADRRMARARAQIDAAWSDYRVAMAEKVRVRRSLGLYVSERDELAAAGACV